MHNLLPIQARAGQIFFAEKIQHHRQVSAASVIVIDQENFGFTPHAIATSLVNSTPIKGMLDIIPTERSVFGRLKLEYSH
ncbi:hypothetical protein [Pseudomonas brassicae]|uniref:hypothetical protein n=1 Tax=Pseudomonas brassicae TaxID=2708063 RepID=UPI001FB3239F|nr:hypothetical protein [Pseudomonas brassicae]